VYDYYETVISGYNKARGSWVHAMFESDRNPPPWVMKERRVVRYIMIDGVSFRLSGQFDEFDTKHGILVDYKSKDNLPLRKDERHEAQFNIYAYLLADGEIITDNDGNPLDKPEKACYTVKRIGAHYVTWKTKTDKAWKKMAYDVWPLEKTEQFIIERAKPLVEWQTTKVIPQCTPFAHNPRWKCDCEKLEEQLAQRGITVEDNPLDR
jgi:RecB family exonuclease